MKTRAIALAVPLAFGMACTHTGQTGAAARPPSEEQQASGGGAGAPLARDPLMRPGPSIQGHSDDQIVTGQVAEATGSSVTIQTPQGEHRTLQIVPETAIEVDGQDASSADLAEGQPVRASFDVVEGQEVAVKIRAGDAAAGATSPADAGTGSSDTTNQEPARPDPGSAAPDAGWGPPGTGPVEGGHPSPR
jgi:hypothetical protein